MAKLNRLTSLLLAAGLCSSGAAFAASGQFTFVIGDVTLQKANGQRVAARAGTDVDPGDSIISGANGMAQLTMVDNARLAVRPNTTFRIDNYPTRSDSEDGALLNLVRGTLRTFTGLIAARNKDKFAMKTRVATVGIRGSGNILYACADAECDPSVTGPGNPVGDFTVNHTIEGNHSITNLLGGPPGTPPQQGGPTTLITGPGQTALVQGNQPPKFIPTPQFISDSANSMTSVPKKGAAPPGNDELRNFTPGDARDGIDNNQTGNVTAGGNGLGFPLIDASGNLGSDPANLRDIVIVAGGPFLGQATQESIVLEGSALRAYAAYRGSQSNITPTIVGGTSRDVQSFSAGSTTVTMGRWETASLGIFGASSAVPVPGSIHWVYAGSGFPTYLSDVLTGTASYTLASATAPTNQVNSVGALGSATLNVNFTNRTLNAALGISMPAANGNGGGTWSLNATNVPYALNAFYASTGGRLVINNGAGQTSTTNPALFGSIEGSFVGSALQGAILGYGFTDQTSTNSSNYNAISGVAGFTGPAQNAAAPFRDGLISDPTGSLGSADFGRNYATVNRPDEVTASATSGAASAFAGPYAPLGGHAQYAQGTASVAQSGVDPETGMIWGRWSGGVATVAANGQTQNINLANASLHYIFAGSQTGPVALPLTGTGVYDVIGSTSPTDAAGHVGTLGSASLNANFTNRTVDTSVNVAINGQTWNGAANNVPIYRDQYFSAYTAGNIPGAPNPAAFNITCTPNCGVGASGSLDGFFAGRTGQRAGMMYNMGGVTGAVAFGRRGGG
jgi:hypothetical protein